MAKAIREGKVTLSGGALAGMTDASGGASGAIVIDITDHEIVDLALSGQAYSLDGKYNFKNKSTLLTPDLIPMKQV